MGRRRRSRRRRRNRRGGKGAGAAKRHSARHGRTDAQMRAAAARRKNKTVKKTSGYHWDGKGKKPLVAAWHTKWKQTKKMPSARKSSSHRVTKKKRSRLGAPPTGHAPAAPSKVSDDLKPISMGSKIASSNVNTAKLAKKTGVSISQVKAGKQAAKVAAKKAAAAVKEAATQTVKKGCPQGCRCDHRIECAACPRVAAGGGRSRRRYAKNAPRAGPRRRRRRSRRR